MTEQRYLRAQSVDEAIAALAQAGDEGLVVAGGIVVGSLINQKLAAPGILIDISRIAALHRLAVLPDGELAIGALTTHDEVLRAALIKTAAPLLAEIARDIACTRLRNRGTLGGSLCTIGGQGDPATGLIALGARLHLRGPAGARVLALEDFYKDAFKVDLRNGELVEEVRVPKSAPDAAYAFCKLGPRNAMDWTQITTSVVLTLDGTRTRIASARIGMNGVAPTPVRPRATEAALQGKPAKALDWTALATILDREIDPQGDLIYSAAYKRHLGAVSLRRAVEQALARVLPAEGRA